MKEVRMTVDYKIHFPESQDLAGSSEERPSDVYTTIPPIKTQVLGEALGLETTEVNSMVKNMGHVTIIFSTIPMYEVYSTQNVTVVEMKVTKCALVKHIR